MSSKKIGSLAMIILIFCSSTVFADSSYKLNEKRIFGKDRYETSAMISKDNWNSSSDVILCNGENFPDALCSVTLAKKYDAPILLVSKNAINENVMKELNRLNPKKITIIGKEGVISSEIEEKIKNFLPKKLQIERLGGMDRYETSKIIADKVGQSREIVLVSGKAPSDALTISSIAANKSMPVLLADENEESIQNYVKNNNVNKAYIIGGESCVPLEMERVAPSFERIYGKDRYESNQKVINRFRDSINFKSVYLTIASFNGVDQFADALSSAPLAAKDCSPIIFSDNTNKELLNIIQSKVNKDSTIIAIGGEKLVSNDTINNLIKSISSNQSNNSSSSGGSNNSNVKADYTLSLEQSFPGAFTYDLKFTSINSSNNLKEYQLLYDGKVIAEDKDGDGVVRVLAIFLGKDIDKSKFQILKQGEYINFNI
ncbi:cell wall-binding repeat-containing protein [Clostridium sp. P21]|uniref:Cell wall-binding repeat-containing protein n=1 Tax=Clostridium muellerianum TaxID=2716538 RepID=A0A7Y0HMQ8_9CLOT|nr:cell wall-binding repeat-containing protein [Clostridium muellerianum]NMM61862.1 cell wall-binding repeat-containing protein [Clostridium muellerianum]